MAEIDNLLRPMIPLNASDLHLRAGMKPRYRLAGRLEELDQIDAVGADDLERVLLNIVSEEQTARFFVTHELDFTYGAPGIGRFRCNYFHDFRGIGAVIRRVPTVIPTLQDLNMPRDIEQFAHLTRGLVLVTGSSGSGKSSTLAALIDVINTNYCRHIVTLEDPVEYLHQNKRSVVHQRGMHYDITDFESGIIAAMRQDPDVIMIGELRDLEAVRRTLTAAETGALVFATLHTNSAADSIDRLIDVFPAEEQAEIRTQLAQSLAGVICQFLLDRLDGKGRTPATEMLIGTPAVSGIIREGNTQDIVNVIQAGRAQGMRSLDESLEELVHDKIVDPRQAYLHARNKARFEGLIAGAEGLALRRSDVSRLGSQAQQGRFAMRR